METSTRAGLPLIKEAEGLRLRAYVCPAGKLTIGYGRTTNVKLGDTISKEQAEAWVNEEYDAFEKKVLALVKVELTANQLGALVSLTYNIGSANFASSTLLKRVNAGKFEEAATQFAVWNKATVAGKKTALPGLTERRAAEAALFRQ